MSLPIKGTPVLEGEDAKKFLQQIKENENKKVSQEELERIESSYQTMLKIIAKSGNVVQSKHIDFPI